LKLGEYEMHNIRIKRIYQKASKDDGLRVLVDRLWPRGITKKDAQVDSWYKDIAPSNSLRKWFGHDPQKWEEFKSRYFLELDKKPEVVAKLLPIADEETQLTLLFSAKDPNFNNAAALKEYLENKLSR
jgi:uncharacterized protein YeaO (DUF488 family)